MKKSNNSGASPTIQTMRIAADIRKFHVHIYFVAPCAVPVGGGSNCTGSSDDNGDPVPTLKRLELTSVGGITVMKVVPIARGVDRMEVDFGLDTSDENTVGSGVPNNYTTTPTATDWENVMTAKVSLLMRNVDATAAHSDTKRYSMGLSGFTTATNDSHRRKVYSSTIRLSNMSSRREAAL